jgi:hypothetical protein
MFTIVGTPESTERALMLLYSQLESEKERRKCDTTPRGLLIVLMLMKQESTSPVTLPSQLNSPPSSSHIVRRPPSPLR